MKKKQDISVVLAVYNGERYLKQQLDSVIAQTEVNLKQLIIVNDCSTDGSLAILEAYRADNKIVEIISNPENCGPVSSFIRGAKMSTAAYTAFADQDDVWNTNKLFISLQLIKEIDADSVPAVVFSDLELITEDGQKTGSSFWELYRIDPAKNSFYTVLFGNIITGCTMLVNNQMLGEFIRMPVEVQMHDHWVALIAFSFGKFNFTYQPTMLYRVHGSSVTSKDKVTQKMVIANFLKASFNKKSSFLNGNITQAKLFKSRYQHRLNIDLTSQLNKFITLEHSSGFFKKLKSKFRF